MTEHHLLCRRAELAETAFIDLADILSSAPDPASLLSNAGSLKAAINGMQNVLKVQQSDEMRIDVEFLHCTTQPHKTQQNTVLYIRRLGLHAQHDAALQQEASCHVLQLFSKRNTKLSCKLTLPKSMMLRCGSLQPECSSWRQATLSFRAS